jgi:hypothetical protein
MNVEVNLAAKKENSVERDGVSKFVPSPHKAGVVGPEIGRKSHEIVMWSNRPDMCAFNPGKK